MAGKGLHSESDVCGFCNDAPANNFKKNQRMFEYTYKNQESSRIPWNAGKGDDDFRRTLKQHWNSKNTSKVGRLFQMLKSKSKLKVLEIGCGQGTFAWHARMAHMPARLLAATQHQTFANNKQEPLILLAPPASRHPPAHPPTHPPRTTFQLANDIKMISKMGFTPTCLELSQTSVEQGRAAKIARATFLLGDVCTMQQTNKTYDVICK